MLPFMTMPLTTLLTIRLYVSNEEMMFFTTLYQ